MTPIEERKIYEKFTRINPVKAIIFLYLITYHSGRENAIPRKEFRKSYGFEEIISDRNLRRFFAIEIPACTCEHGTFWPLKQSEVKDSEIYLKKKAISILVRNRRVRQAHSCLAVEVGIQKELFS